MPPIGAVDTGPVVLASKGACHGPPTLMVGDIGGTAEGIAFLLKSASWATSRPFDGPSCSDHDAGSDRAI